MFWKDRFFSTLLITFGSTEITNHILLDVSVLISTPNLSKACPQYEFLKNSIPPKDFQAYTKYLQYKYEPIWMKPSQLKQTHPQKGKLHNQEE